MAGFDAIPLVGPKDVAAKNTGRYLALRIKGREFEFKYTALKELQALIEYITKVKHPTEWITGAEDMAKAEGEDLWST